MQAPINISNITYAPTTVSGAYAGSSQGFNFLRTTYQMWFNDTDAQYNLVLKNPPLSAHTATSGLAATNYIGPETGQIGKVVTGLLNTDIMYINLAPCFARTIWLSGLVTPYTNIYFPATDGNLYCKNSANAWYFSPDDGVTWTGARVLPTPVARIG